MPVLAVTTIEHRSFPTSFRGYDQNEVRAFIRQVADTVRALEHEIADLRAQAATPPPEPVAEFDEETVARALGEETARVLVAAREAAAEIRAKAEESVARLVREATEEANRVRTDAETTAREQTEAAETEASRIREAATADAETLRTEAERVRAEADEAAAAARLEADEHARASRLEADRDANHIRAEAAELAAADTEAAKHEGRALLEEARQLRQRVLDDLAIKRKAGRVQLEQLRGGRDRLLEAYEVVRRTLEEATSELEQSVDAARTAADQAARRAEVEPTPGAEDVEVELAADAEDVEVEAESAVADGADDDGGMVDDAGAPPAKDDTRIDAIFASLRLRSDEAEPIAAIEAPEVTESGFERVPEAEAAAGTKAPPDASDQPEGETPVRTSADESLLERRDAATEAVEQQLVRGLKRVLADEQNEVLDRLRRNPAGGNDAILSDGVAQTARYVERASGELGRAASAGASFFGAGNGSGNGSASARPVAVDDLATELASAISGQIRDRVGRTLIDRAGDEDAMADGIRACYREWKAQHIGETARHYVLAAFTRGVYQSVPDGGCLRWLVDDGGSPCPDAEDNALAGAVVKGDPFPTGHEYPPAHPGCRCLVVPTPH